ncbi:lipase family protein [Pseudoxanthomonas wuyuanensis]
MNSRLKPVSLSVDLPAGWMATVATAIRSMFAGHLQQNGTRGMRLAAAIKRLHMPRRHQWAKLIFLLVLATCSLLTSGEKLNGEKGQMQHRVGEHIRLESVTFTVLEHMARPSGYHGTIYQRVDTGEIVVVHRGTGPDQGLGQILRDGALTDGAMATARINPQSADAIALTQRAIDRAKDIGGETGITPEVTVTGHSLGGTHAQITAHQFGLRGETSNACGAVSFAGRILQHAATQATTRLLA